MNHRWLIAAAALVAGCASDMKDLQGYSKDIAAKQNEIDLLDREISALKKGPTDSLTPRKIDSLEVRRSRSEADLIDLKASASKEGEQYRKDHEGWYKNESADPKRHPIK